MRKYRASALAVLVGAVLASSYAMAQDGDDDDEAGQAGAATEQVTRASKNVPELVLGTKEDQFAVNRKDFELIAGQGYRWKISAAGGARIQVPHRSLPRRLDEPDRHRRSRGAHERRAGLARI